MSFLWRRADRKLHKLLKYDSFFNSFQTSDGTSRQEKGTLKQLEDGNQALEVTGSYQYVAPDGQIYAVTYVADENGYKAQEHSSQW